MKIKNGRKYRTLSEKRKLMQTFAEMVHDLDIPLIEICKKLGFPISSIYDWIKKDKIIAEIHSRASIDRAYQHVTRAGKVIDAAGDFWEDNKGNKREQFASVPKAKLQAEYHYRWASWLAPHIFGDQAKELKEIIREVKQIKKELNK